MKEKVNALRSGRVRIILINLAYFAALLVLGYLIFVKGSNSILNYVLIAAAIVGYIGLIRPMTKKHMFRIREAVLSETTLKHFKHPVYEPKNGVTLDMIRNSGLINDENPASFLSRQHISGTVDGVLAEMADVSFPIHEGGKNAMFTGVYLRLSKPGSHAEPIEVRSGDLKSVHAEARQMALLKEMCAFIPGSIYLKIEGDHADFLFRGRFIDYRINPLVNVTEAVLRTDPLPEVGQALKLFAMRRNGKA